MPAERELIVGARCSLWYRRAAIRLLPWAAVVLLAACRADAPAPPPEHPGSRVDAASRELADPGLGVIADAVGDRFGRVYALDVSGRSVAVSDPATGRTTRLGRPGRGPGEFVAPLALEMDAQGRVLVLDPGALRIERYRASREAVQREPPLPLAFPPEDLAVCGGRLYLLGSWNGYLLHQIGAADGRIVRSFAPSPVSSSDLMAAYHSTDTWSAARKKH